MITKKHFVGNILAGLCVVALAATCAAKETKRPNIVFFLTDDQPLRAMSHIDPWFHTPNMDKLASEGITFQNAYVESAVCCVSRASMMMGQFNSFHGIQSFDDPLSHEQLEQSFPVLLRKSGYRTALLGKYGVGHTRSGAPKELCLPADYFDLWYGFPQGPSYAQEVEGEKRYLTSVMEEKAIRFMKETPEDQPFLLYMCLPEPHGQGGKGGPWNYRDPDFDLPAPVGAPPKPETMTTKAYDALPEAIKNGHNKNVLGKDYKAGIGSYADYMTIVRDYTARSDLAIGRIREAIKGLSREENTVILFISDNGSMWGGHGIEGKWNMYEESIRVPAMIYDPRLPESVNGSREQMALNIDFTATVLDLAGLPAPEAMQGQSLLPILKDPEVKGRKDWYYHHDIFSRAKGPPLPRCEGVRTERWKYIHYKDTDPVQEELFDLDDDPLEERNLASNPEYATVLNQLRSRNEALRNSLGRAE